MMKKFVALLLALCIAFAVFAGCNRTDTANDVNTVVETPIYAQEDSTAQDTTEGDGTVTAATTQTESIDFAALYATHEPDEVVAVVNGRDVTWQSYFYWLYTQAIQIQNYFTQMSAYYAEVHTWDEVAYEESGTTFAQATVDNAAVMLRQLHGIEDFAAENGVELTEADETAIAAQLESDIKSICGEEATEDEFNAKIADSYLTRELYDRINRIDKLYANGFTNKYGENGSKVDDETAVKYLEDNGYLSATHILFMTIDPTTREALDEAAVAEKKAQAEKIAEELAAITDPAELTARFAELKEEYDEDTGKTIYPDGYVFTEGTMVTEFEDAVKSLDAGEVSGVVESSYGYHIIMRLAPDAERTVSYSSDGATAYSPRYLYASNAYAEEVEKFVDEIEIDFADGFEINLLNYVVKGE